jgi:hypothetical protein
MGRYTEPERAKVEFETLRVQAFFLDLLYEKIMLVDALGTT